MQFLQGTCKLRAAVPKRVASNGSSWRGTGIAHRTRNWVNRREIDRKATLWQQDAYWHWHSPFGRTVQWRAPRRWPNINWLGLIRWIAGMTPCRPVMTITPYLRLRGESPTNCQIELETASSRKGKATWTNGGEKIARLKVPFHSIQMKTYQAFGVNGDTVKM